MKTNRKRSVLFLGLVAALVVATSSPAIAGAHTWVVNEVFSNADGTIQFVEIQEASGGAAENGIGGAFIVSTTLARSYDIPSNVVGTTSSKTVLFGTPAFCALFNQLPGNPTCDFTFAPAQVPFFSTNADSLRYSPYQAAPGFQFTAGQLPTDGVSSRTRPGTNGPNTPKNFAGLGGTVNANTPAGVPDGTGGSTPMTATRLDAGATSVQVLWDTATCAAGSPDNQIIYGDRSNLPATPAGAFTVAGAACALGTTSPYTWNSVPSAGDGSGLLWWLVVVKQGTTEGAWGDNTIGERTGPGTGGCSGQCGVTSKSVSNTCGH